MVLTQLAPGVAAKVLNLMSPQLAADLAARISTLDEIPEHAVAEASESLVRALDLDQRENLKPYPYFNDPSYAGPQPVDEDVDGVRLHFGRELFVTLA